MENVTMGRPEGRTIKVLIIDDERDLVELLALRFRVSPGFAVALAMDGESGLRRVKEFGPDVVLVDLLMPGIDGWEVCRRLRMDPATKELPILVMTALRSPDIEDRARAWGVARFLQKPFDDRLLVRHVRESVIIPG